MKYIFLFCILFQIESAIANSNKCEALFKNPWVSRFDNRRSNSVTSFNIDTKAAEPAWIVTLQGVIGRGYFKPVHHSKQDKNRLSRGYSSVYHEVAAYRVSEILGFKIVPETTLTTLEIDAKNVQGSLQTFVDGKTAHELAQQTGQSQRENNMIWLFHQIIANTTKFDGNYLTTNWGQQIATNNARSFYLENPFDSNLNRPEITAEIRAQVAQVIKKNPKLLEKILNLKKSEIHEALSELLLPEQIQALWVRLVSLKELCKNIVTEQASRPPFVHDQKTQDLIRFIQSYEAALAKKLNRDTNILYSSVCYEASMALLSILPENLKSKVIPVGTSFYTDANEPYGYQHYFLVIPNYFAVGKHLYIDPTFQQFAYNYVNPKIFVGSLEDLIPFAQARGILEKEPRFIEQYTALVNPASSPLKPFEHPN